METLNLQLLNSINGSYQAISDQLYRPKEDLVEISICSTTKGTIEKILRFYLESKGVQNADIKNINDLMNTCAKQNSNFNKFDISSLSCRCEPSEHNVASYCTGDEKLNSCFRILDEMRAFVFNELNIGKNN